MPSLDPEKIAQIRKLAADGATLYRISKTVGAAHATVRKYAPEGAFDRTATAAAVKAHQVDAAARRETQRLRYLDIVDEYQHRALEEYEHAQPTGAEGIVQRWKTRRPPARDGKDLIAAANMATTAELKLAEYKDRDGGTEGIASILDFDRQAREQYDANHPAAG